MSVFNAMSCPGNDRENSILLKTAIFHVLANVACECIKKLDWVSCIKMCNVWKTAH